MSIDVHQYALIRSGIAPNLKRFIMVFDQKDAV
jgi:hypothetical protein